MFESIIPQDQDWFRWFIIIVAFSYMVTRVVKMFSRKRNRYVGERDSKGKRHGKGIQHLSNGDRFEGTFAKDQYHKGTYFYSKGGYYTGSFKDTKPSGIGEEVYNDGETKYVGNFSKGNRHGQGKLVYKSGSEYDGNWKDGRKHGKGTHKTAMGVYIGDFFEGKKHGQGVMTYKSGEFQKYKGRWKEGVFAGKGTIFFRDGGRWQGLFDKGCQHGEGVYFSKNGEKAIHKYEHGRVIEVIKEDKKASK
mmetsp:Transcript_7049/g.11603  ORF Transcript_7049/g.11603 Transcript_7049/m.11603 type:complete len:248 (+) Transcript_7049:34-777(+)